MLWIRINPHHCGSLDSHPDPHQIKIRIWVRIRIRVISRIRIRITVMRIHNTVFKTVPDCSLFSGLHDGRLRLCHRSHCPSQIRQAGPDCWHYLYSDFCMWQIRIVFGIQPISDLTRDLRIVKNHGSVIFVRIRIFPSTIKRIQEKKLDFCRFVTS